MSIDSTVNPSPLPQLARALGQVWRQLEASHALDPRLVPGQYSAQPDVSMPAGVASDTVSGDTDGGGTDSDGFDLDSVAAVVRDDDH